MATKITYYLPKKIVKISFPLTIVEKKTTYNSGRAEVSPVEAYIKGEIKIIPLLLPDEQRGTFAYLPDDISVLKKNTVSVEYDAEGAGLLMSLNAAQNNLIGDVINATIDVAAAVLGSKALTPAAMSAVADPVASVDYVERQLDIVQLVTPGRGKTVAIALPELPASPRISIAFRDSPGAVYTEASAVTDEGRDDKNNVWYLVAKPLILSIIVENNAYIPKQTVAEDIVYFPQFGELRSVPVVRKSWWFFGAVNTVLNFSPSTGSLQKVCFTAETNIKDLLADTQKGITDYQELQPVARPKRPRRRPR